MEHIFMQQELLSFENMHTSNGKFAPTHLPLLPEYELRTTNIHGYLYLYPRGHPRAPADTIRSVRGGSLAFLFYFLKGKYKEQ
jgi:hypothetical protein